MEKNEKGYPLFCTGRCTRGFVPTFNSGSVGGVTDNGSNDQQSNRPGNGCSGGMGNGNGSMNGGCGSMNGGCGSMNGGCGGGDSCLDRMEPAYVYAPSQKFCMLYSAEDALAHGTLFEQLYKPREVYGRE